MSRPLYMDASMLELERLLDATDAGALAVPDFQREFVWSDLHVKSLLGTVFNAWPAGSLLLVRGDFHQFRLRPLEGAPPLREIKYVVLDGQQRLTALYNALRDAGPSVYGIDIADIEKEEPEDINLEERMRAVKREVWDRQYAKPQEQLSRGLLPLVALSSPASYFEWRDDILASSRTGKSTDSIALRQSLTDLYRERLASIHRYSFPTVYLDSSLNVAAIAGIFEKVNRSGLQLGTFDLMVARVYDPQWNLRDEWESARLEFPVLEDFLGQDGMPLLQAIALRRHASIRQTAVLEMRSEVREDWGRSVQASSRAITYFRDGCGTLTREWLPYNVLLVGAAALMMDNSPVADDELARWFWSKSFSGGFDVAANTRVVTDYQRLRAHTLLADPAPVSTETLLTSTRRTQRALWAAFISALASVKGGDVLGYSMDSNGEPVPFTASNKPTIISALPRDVSPSFGEAPLHLRTLGLVLATHRSASLIRRLGFVGAVAFAVEEQGEAAVDRALNAQWLDTSAEIRERGGEATSILRGRLSRLSKWLSSWGVRVVDPDESG